MTEQDKDKMAFVDTLSAELSQLNDDYENAPTEAHRRAVAITRSQTIARLNNLLNPKYGSTCNIEKP